MISENSQRTSSFLIGCSGWNYGDTPDKGGWTEVFTLIKKQKDYAITPNSLKLQKWIPHFITDSIQK
jgi:hypothetical protein